MQVVKKRDALKFSIGAETTLPDPVPGFQPVIQWDQHGRVRPQTHLDLVNQVFIIPEHGQHDPDNIEGHLLVIIVDTQQEDYKDIKLLRNRIPLGVALLDRGHC